MKTKEKLVPELRFPEFTDEWEEKKLGEMVEISSEKYNPKKEIGFYQSIELENLEQGTGRLLNKNEIDSKTSTKNVFHKGDVLFGKLRPYLRKFYKPIKKGICSSEIWVFKVRDGFNSNYIYRLVQTDYFLNISNVTIGTKMPRADWSYMKKKTFVYPSLPEQQKIGNFFSKIDEKLELQRKRIEELKTYKKGMMQRIFNQEIRFKDEKGNEYPEWEEKKLGEVSKVIKGDQLNKSNFVENGEYYVLNGGKELSGWTDDWNTQANTISISEGGESCGFVNYNTEKFWSGGHLYTLEELKKDINNIYLYQYLKQKEKLIMRLRVGSGLPNIQIKDIRNFKMQLPSLPEQEKIANFLSAIDEKIELEEEKLKEFEEFKKGLMQRMFI